METTLQAPQRVKTVYNIMKLTYGLVPIIAGLDKFTNLLTNWEKYINPQLAEMLPFTPATFMMIIGVVEIIAGLIVLAKPSIGGYIVMAWLTLIALTLLAGKQYLDVAVRDLVMAIGAFALAQLAHTVVASKKQHAPKSAIAFS